MQIIIMLTMKLLKLIFLVLLIILIKKMELMIYNGVSYKHYKILRLSLLYGVQVVDYKVFFHFMQILKLLNKKMTGLQHWMLMVVVQYHNISILLLMLVLKLWQKNLFKMLLLGLVVIQVLMLLEVLDLHLKYTIEIQDYLNLVLINHFQKKYVKMFNNLYLQKCSDVVRSSKRIMGNNERWIDKSWMINFWNTSWVS